MYKITTIDGGNTVISNCETLEEAEKTFRHLSKKHTITKMKKESMIDDFLTAL